MYIDTGLLRDHVSKLRENKKTAIRLYEKVLDMRRADDPTISYRYTSVLREIEQLIEYFDRMALLLDNVADDAIELSQKLGNSIQQSTGNTRRTISKHFLL